MIKLIKTLSLCFVCISLCNCADESDQEKIAPQDFDLKQELYDTTYSTDVTPTEISGVQMILIKNGEIVFEHADGLARRIEGADVPLTTDHKVRIASISKFVLTVAFMTLVEEGKVDLDADVSDYLGFSLRNPNFPDRMITARQVLAHVSSIRDGSYYFMGPDQNFKDFFILGKGPKSLQHFENGAHFANGENQGPGDYFTYSNLNFGIISGIAEKVSGKRMDLFVKEHLLDPLGLNSSFSVCTLYENDFAQLATLYRRGDGGETWDLDGPWIEQVDGDPVRCYYESPLYARGETPDLSSLDAAYELGKNPTLFSPQGGLRASSKDLAVIMKMLLNEGEYDGKQIMSKSSIAEMMTPVWQYNPALKNGHTGGEAIPGDSEAAGMMTTYGLSTHIVDLKDWDLSETSKILYGHLGSAYGLQGQFWFDPINKDGIVTFITGVGDDPGNAQATIPLYAIEERLLRLGLRGLETY
tara:strand:+ start:33721 stop:35133 length:1413 start_codon:yes stop_codon:yes gene_type:complete